jgi:hypothetical protein
MKKIFSSLAVIGAGYLVKQTIAADKHEEMVPLAQLNERWVPYSEVDFSDCRLVSYIIDTRDFHCRMGKDISLLDGIDLHKTRKNPERYFHTPEEVKALLDRYYTESGGAGDWRHFHLKGIFRSENWQMKYIRIYRFYSGLVVCNDKQFVFNKADLAAPIDQKHLHKS